MNNGKDILKSFLVNIPNKTGIYKYFNEKNEIIYVGKAIDLHKRILTYLDEEKTSPKTKKLVKNIARVEFTLVDTEQDAFLLENNLIKKYQPFYNILLKDGKSYPKIIITDELYPRVFSIRDVNKIKGEIYGPYSNKKNVDYIIDTINQLYPIRNCKYNLSKNKKMKVCLKFYLGKCCGICENKISALTYNDWIKQIRLLIKGDVQEIITNLKNEMRKASENLEYENAEKIKNKLQILLNFKSKSIITNTNLDNVDVYAYKENKNEVYITFIHINKGSITQTKTVEYKINLDESKEYILSMAIKDTRDMLKSNANTIIVPFIPEITENSICRKPKNSTEKELLNLAIKNVEEYYLEKIKQEYKLNPEQRYTKLLTKFVQYFHLKKNPIMIDSFDVSHIQGSNAVGCCVCFNMGKPLKSNYQKFIIKNDSGNNDFLNTQEIVKRRYADNKKNIPLPDLIIADGGEIQMNAINDIVNKELKLNIEVIGLKKDKKHITNKIIYGTPFKEIDIPIKDDLFNLLAKIQNEVHRFAISFHKNKRSQAQNKSLLDSIDGIGPKTKELLILKYKSIIAIKRVDLEELTRTIGKEKANKLYKALHENELF